MTIIGASFFIMAASLASSSMLSAKPNARFAGKVPGCSRELVRYTFRVITKSGVQSDLKKSGVSG